MKTWLRSLWLNHGLILSCVLWIITVMIERAKASVTAPLPLYCLNQAVRKVTNMETTPIPACILKISKSFLITVSKAKNTMRMILTLWRNPARLLGKRIYLMVALRAK